LAIAGILALAFGIWKISHNIKSPFKLQPMQNLSNENIFDSQTKDTDGDGLTDFDETNFYNTSPYLEDTDSDSLPDGDEIKNNTDPNCATGRICAESETGVEDKTSFIGSQMSATSSLNIDLLNFSVKDIRELLKASGMKEEDLNKLDDDTLMQIYQEALKDSNKEE